MLNQLDKLYNWMFSDTIPEQLKKLQFDKPDLLEIYDELNLSKLNIMQNFSKSLIVVGGYLNSDPQWTLVCTLPSFYYHDNDALHKYILTNFKISNQNYDTLSLTIDDIPIIDDFSHPWREQWRTHNNCTYNCSNNSDSFTPISYLTFPIPQIHNQTISFKVTFSKNALKDLDDPHNVRLSYDVCCFNDKKDELDFFNVWRNKKYNTIIPLKYSNNCRRNELILPKYHTYYEIIIFRSNISSNTSSSEIFKHIPLETIKLTDHNDKVHLLDIKNRIKSGDHIRENLTEFYRIILTDNYIDGLSGADWKNIEIIPSFNYRDADDHIYLLCSSKMTFKNNKYIYPS